MSLLVPAAVTTVFTLMYLTNAAIPDSNMVSQVDIASGDPLSLSVACKTHDAFGNSNPFCPGAASVVIPPPIGFQFVPTLQGSGCAQTIGKALSRNVSQTWLTGVASPAIASVEIAQGIPPQRVADTGDPFSLIYFHVLASDESIDPGDLWDGAGTFLAPFPAGESGPSLGLDPAGRLATLANASALARNVGLAAAYPGLLRTDLLAPITFPGDVYSTAAAAAAVSPPSTITMRPVPLCPFPVVQHSASLSSTLPASGVGFLLTLPPYFNWSSYLNSGSAGLAAGQVSQQLVHRLMPSSPSDQRIPAAGVPIVTVKGVSALGGSPFADELQVWQWYARTMAYTNAPMLTLPWIEYAVDVTRNLYSNGSITVVATATVSTGLFTQGDESNYYGYGESDFVLNMAGCGDLYSLAAEDLDALYAVASQLGFNGTYSDFTADGSAALADLLPPYGPPIAMGCGSEAAALQGWPVPSCDTAQALRSGALALLLNASGGGSGIEPVVADMPLLFNVSALGTGAVDALAAVYVRIRARSDALVHRNLLPWALQQPAARAHINSMGAMMQAQHGCGLYCADSIAYGVGVASMLWLSPSTSQLEPNTTTAGAPAQRNAVVYVQRRRPAVVCDNASFPLPWTRADPNEYFAGDFSLSHLSTSAAGLSLAKLTAPAVVVLFRSNSWTDVRWSNGKQSLLAIIGAAAGFTSSIVAALILIKQWYYILQPGSLPAAARPSASTARLSVTEETLNPFAMKDTQARDGSPAALAASVRRRSNSRRAAPLDADDAKLGAATSGLSAVAVPMSASQRRRSTVRATLAQAEAPPASVVTIDPLPTGVGSNPSVSASNSVVRHATLLSRFYNFEAFATTASRAAGARSHSASTS